MSLVRLTDVLPGWEGLEVDWTVTEEDAAGLRHDVFLCGNGYVVKASSIAEATHVRIPASELVRVP